MACRASLAKHKIKVRLTTGDTFELTDRSQHQRCVKETERSALLTKERTGGGETEVTVVTGAESLGMTPKVSKQLWINKSMRASGREEKREGVERGRGSFFRVICSEV